MFASTWRNSVLQRDLFFSIKLRGCFGRSWLSPSKQPDLVTGSSSCGWLCTHFPLQSNFIKTLQTSANAEPQKEVRTREKVEDKSKNHAQEMIFRWATDDENQTETIQRRPDLLIFFMSSFQQIYPVSVSNPLIFLIFNRFIWSNENKLSRFTGCL